MNEIKLHLCFLVFCFIATPIKAEKPPCTVDFDNPVLDLGDMATPSTFGITYSKCKDKIVSIESNHTLENGNRYSIGYSVEINGGAVITKNGKNKTKTITITPNSFPITQRSGVYHGTITIVLSDL